MAITVIDDVKLDYDDVLLVPQKTDVLGFKKISRSDINLIASYGPARGTVPIIAANMDYVGTFKMAIELSKYNIWTALNKHYTVNELVKFFLANPTLGRSVAYSLGSNKTDLDKIADFMALMGKRKADPESYPAILCCDVANGYNPEFLDVCSKLKKLYPKFKLMAGNVVTPERVTELLAVGVDIVKVGIGPGSACSTRRETGVGYPQFSAVLECAAAGPVCADGGIQNPGDVAKALAAGAQMVMIGGEFAGHDEGYELVELMQKDLPFHGMASKAAQDKHNGGLANYRASEGKIFKIPRKGPIAGTIQHYLGGLRSSCTYQGVMNISEIREDPVFVKVSRQLNTVYDRFEV